MHKGDSHSFEVVRKKSIETNPFPPSRSQVVRFDDGQPLPVTMLLTTLLLSL